MEFPPPPVDERADSPALDCHVRFRYDIRELLPDDRQIVVLAEHVREIFQFFCGRADDRGPYRLDELQMVIEILRPFPPVVPALILRAETRRLEGVTRASITPAEAFLEDGLGNRSTCPVIDSRSGFVNDIAHRLQDFRIAEEFAPHPLPMMSQAGQDVFERDSPAGFRLQFPDGLHQDIGVAKRGEPVADVAERAVLPIEDCGFDGGAHKSQDGPNPLRPLPHLVNAFLEPGPSQVAPNAVELLGCNSPDATRQPLPPFQMKAHAAQTIISTMKLHELPPFVRGSAFRVVVESPRGASAKLKFDPDCGAMTLSRPLTLGLTYPFDWGFVPGTRMPDGDPTDAFLVWDTQVFPGVVIPCRAVGLVKVDQRKKQGRGRERNDRILAVPLKAPRMDHIRTSRDLPARVRRELEEFFVQVTALEDKDVRILGWDGPASAIRLIKTSAVSDRPTAQRR